MRFTRINTARKERERHGRDGGIELDDSEDAVGGKRDIDRDLDFERHVRLALLPLGRVDCERFQELVNELVLALVKLCELVLRPGAPAPAQLADLVVGSDLAPEQQRVALPGLPAHDVLQGQHLNVVHAAVGALAPVPALGLHCGRYAGRGHGGAGLDDGVWSVEM